jgi:hypothetical protein
MTAEGAKVRDLNTENPSSHTEPPSQTDGMVDLFVALGKLPQDEFKRLSADYTDSHRWEERGRFASAPICEICGSRIR